MHSIKTFVLSIIIIMFFFGVITLFLPSKVTVSKSVIINATGNEVAKEIETFQNWKDWYPAFQNQNITIKTFQKGDFSFVTLTDGTRTKLSLSMIKQTPENVEVIVSEVNKNNITYQFILLPGRTGRTEVTWNVNITLPWYPWKKITGIFLDKITGPQYQEALQNLKIAVEKIHQQLPSK